MNLLVATVKFVALEFGIARFESQHSIQNLADFAEHITASF